MIESNKRENRNKLMKCGRSKKSMKKFKKIKSMILNKKRQSRSKNLK